MKKITDRSNRLLKDDRYHSRKIVVIDVVNYQARN